MSVNKWFTLLTIISFFLISCNTKEKTDTGQVQGGEKSGKTKVLEAGAKMLQSKHPVDAIGVYLDGFHFRSGDMKDQMEAHHYCTRLNEDVIQCVLYDGNTKNAKLIGIEYVISERMFKSLPAEEKHLWHSHHYEVKSGTLIAPGIPDAATHELMEQLVSTYGKTWHTWDTMKDKIPVGIPHLMMGFTKDGQASPEMISSRDKRFGVSSEQQKENRKDIPMPQVDPDANAWEKGIVPQFSLRF